MTNNRKQAIVIGGGCAGLTASIYLSRAGVETKVFTGYEHGSLSDSPFVENFPGFPDGISGFDLVEKMRCQALHHGVKIIDEIIEDINPFDNLVTSDSGFIYAYDGLVVATGAKPRKLTAENANEYEHKGIHYCAVCDGALYKNKVVGVIGGGDTALTEALYLSKICKRVIMFVRRDKFRGSDVLAKRVLDSWNCIDVVWNTQIISVDGKGKLENIEFTAPSDMKNVKGDYGPDFEKGKMQIDALFVAIGTEPNDKLIKNAFGEDCKDKYIGNVVIAGDCFSNPYRQAVIACADGAKAAMYLNETVF